MTQVAYVTRTADKDDISCRTPIIEFVRDCCTGAIVDSDGEGYYGYVNCVTDIPAIPSEIKNGGTLLDYEYVYWYNN